MDTKGILMYDESTCRLCMTQQSGVIDINSSICSKSGRIIDMVRYCYDIEMIIHDALPNLICNECALHLNVSCNLKGKCLTSEKYFLDYLTTTEVDTKQFLISRTILEPEPEPPILPDRLETHTSSTNPSTHSDNKALVNLNIPIPPTPAVDTSESTEIKYIRPNLLAYFGNNAIFELSDTDSDTDNEERPVERVNGDTETTTYECPACPDKFKDLFTYNKHVKDHPKKICKVCHRVCTVGSNLISHFRTHQPSQKIKCPNCNYASFVRTTVCQHIRKYHNKDNTMENNNPLKCLKCSTVFASFEEFRLHLHTNHHIVVQSNTEAAKLMTLADSDALKCKECGRQLTNSTTFTLHMKLHQQFKLKYCYVCKSSFRHNMFEHFKVNHPGLPPYKCPDHCNATFTSIKLFEAHKKNTKRNSLITKPTTTTTTVPISSDIPRYSLPSDLNRNATNLPALQKGYDYVLLDQVEPFECYICDLKVESETHLNNHMELHLTKKCKKCSRVFGNIRALSGHYKLKHPRTDTMSTYQCGECGKCFDKLYNFKRHQLIHTKKTPTTLNNPNHM